jgi:hypothetical protein
VSYCIHRAWRELITEHYSQEAKKDEDTERVLQRRTELEAEQKRLVMAFTKGYITEEELDAQVEHIRSELFTLPVPAETDEKTQVQIAISAGETLIEMASRWSEAPQIDP